MINFCIFVKTYKMKTEDLFKLVLEGIGNMTNILAMLMNELTEKLIIADGDNIGPDGQILIEDVDGEEIDNETYDKLCSVESHIFNAFGNIVKAKEAIGEELDIAELMLKTQYETEMAEAMEMYREFKNTEEILNGDDNKEK